MDALAARKRFASYSAAREELNTKVAHSQSFFLLRFSYKGEEEDLRRSLLELRTAKTAVDLRDVSGVIRTPAAEEPEDISASQP